MSKIQLDMKVTELDKAMSRLRETMTALPNRLGGFTKEHTDMARKVAGMLTTLEAARPLFDTDRRRPKARK